MRTKIDFTKSAQQNADAYFSRAKKLKQKKEGAEKAITELRKRLEKAKKDFVPKDGRRIIVKRDKGWYEKFRWFFTSDGHLVIGGRDAHQNELLNARHFEDNDLFFHADIFGAQVTILKAGMSAEKGVREEAAQFAACHSSAWKEGQRTVDVYAMRRDQVSKSQAKGTLGTGSFLLSGEREWYRDMVLALVAFIKDGTLNVVPEIMFEKLEKPEMYVRISQGNDRKSDAAKKIGKILQYENIDEIMQLLPTDGFRTRPHGAD
jgi:predicted ribosome quality control (RQC) complex YloA/Tae2 family protein